MGSVACIVVPACASSDSRWLRHSSPTNDVNVVTDNCKSLTFGSAVDLETTKPNFSDLQTVCVTIAHNTHSLELRSGVGCDILKYRKYLRNKIAKFEKYVFFMQLSE